MEVPKQKLFNRISQAKSFFKSFKLKSFSPIAQISRTPQPILMEKAKLFLFEEHKKDSKHRGFKII